MSEITTPVSDNNTQTSTPLGRSTLVSTLLVVCIISTMMVLTALCTSVLLKPQGNNGVAKDSVVLAAPPDLDVLFPENFGGWTRQTLSAAVLPQESVVGPGEAVAYRAYRNQLGRVVTLVVAYGPPASDSVRLHRPETCYTGHGYAVTWRKRGVLTVDGSNIPVNRLVAENTTRQEAISYWLRAGDEYAVSAAAHQWINLRQGLGRTADGVLVRISSQGSGEQEFDLHLDFMRALLGHINNENKKLLIAARST